MTRRRPLIVGINNSRSNSFRSRRLDPESTVTCQHSLCDAFHPSFNTADFPLPREVDYAPDVGGNPTAECRLSQDATVRQYTVTQPRIRQDPGVIIAAGCNVSRWLSFLFSATQLVPGYSPWPCHRLRSSTRDKERVHEAWCRHEVIILPRGRLRRPKSRIQARSHTLNPVQARP